MTLVPSVAFVFQNTSCFFFFTKAHLWNVDVEVETVFTLSLEERPMEFDVVEVYHLGTGVGVGKRFICTFPGPRLPGALWYENMYVMKVDLIKKLKAHHA